jgi:histidinol dehydrogenase
MVKYIDLQNSENRINNFDGAAISHDCSIDTKTNKIVANIIDDIAKDSNKILEYTKKFENWDCSFDNIKIDPEEIQAADRGVSSELYEALRFAYQRIISYHKKQTPKDMVYKDELSVDLGWKWYPIEKVGLYIPAGVTSYPSSVLMTAAIANAAGVKEVNIVTPCKGGKISQTILAAAKIANVKNIFKIGGAQSIAALTFGVNIKGKNIIPKVDKIYGPGNKYVTEAKRQLFGKVGIDMLAGPSEIMIIANSKISAKWIAADLLAQAEHDANARVYLVTDEKDFAQEVEVEIKRYLKNNQSETAKAAIQENCFFYIVSDLVKDAINLANLIAPEHLEISVDNFKDYTDEITKAGAFFLGRYSCESLGDYVAGASHVLPTSGSARFCSGLSIFDFMRRTSTLHVNKKAFSEISKAAKLIADAESLQFHAEAITARRDYEAK